MVDLADCLLVIDLQNGVCKSKQSVANFKQLIEQVNVRIEIYKANKKGFSKEKPFLLRYELIHHET